MSTWNTHPLDPQPLDLSSLSFSKRAAAVAATEENLVARTGRHIASLQKEIGLTHKLVAQEKESIAERVAARFDELDAALAVDTLVELEPLARAYAAAPRATASKIASAWRSLQARAREELGTEIHCAHLVIAFAVAAGFADMFGVVDAFHFDGVNAAHAADEASRAILADAHDAIVDDAIRRLEVAVVKQAQARPYVDAERAKAKRSRVTAAGMRGQEQRVDAERAAAVEPAPMPDHVKVL